MASVAPIDRQHMALQTIFSFFLGLMVVAFIGVGVNTFYPSPQERHQQAQTDLSRQMETVSTKSPSASIDASTQAELARLQVLQNALQDTVNAEMKIWARNTSIVLVLFATLVMGVSLVRSDELRVLSNGLLLGGLFTMVYGAGWVIFSGNSLARFVVILFALVVTIGLGYLKFVRGRADASAAAPAAMTGAMTSAGDDSVVSALQARVSALEDRAAAAAAALGGAEPPDRSE